MFLPLHTEKLALSIIEHKSALPQRSSIMRSSLSTLEAYHFVPIVAIRDEELMFDGEPLSNMFESIRQQSIIFSVTGIRPCQIMCLQKTNKLGTTESKTLSKVATGVPVV
jgi:hypothetical protein